MCEHRLCLDLMDSLNAAIRGMDGRGDLVGSWGREVMEALQYSLMKSRFPPNLLYQIAFDLLQGIIEQCPCEGLAEAILHDPERFFRAIVVLAAQYAPPPASALPVVLH